MPGAAEGLRHSSVEFDLRGSARGEGEVGMHPFFWIAFLIFAGALYAAGYYLWTVPEKHAADMLGARLRELRANVRSRAKGQPELLLQQRRGTFAFLGDFVSWIGVLRRLQLYINQANLKYRAADVFGISVAIAVILFLLLMVAGMSMVILRLMVSVAVASLPIV